VKRGDIVSRSLARFVGIMNTLDADRPNASLAEIANATGLDKSTAHRLLGALERHGLVRRDSRTKRYSLGSTTMAWGANAFASVEMRATAEPVLRELNAKTRENVSLWMLDGLRRVCVWTVESPQLVRHVVELGFRLPLTQGAGGKLTLALMPPDEALAIIRADRELDDGQKCRLIDELPEVRCVGYGMVLREESAHAWSMAAPIFDRTGIPSATVVIAGPSDRLRDDLIDQYVRDLLQAAERISRELGAGRSAVELVDEKELAGIGRRR
jgi:IclR family KDG regulon transcriptional repressor